MWWVLCVVILCLVIDHILTEIKVNIPGTRDISVLIPNSPAVSMVSAYKKTRQKYSAIESNILCRLCPIKWLNESKYCLGWRQSWDPRNIELGRWEQGLIRQKSSYAPLDGSPDRPMGGEGSGKNVAHCTVYKYGCSDSFAFTRCRHIQCNHC